MVGASLALALATAGAAHRALIEAFAAGRRGAAELRRAHHGAVERQPRAFSRRWGCGAASRPRPPRSADPCLRRRAVRLCAHRCRGAWADCPRLRGARTACIGARAVGALRAADAVQLRMPARVARVEPGRATHGALSVGGRQAAGSRRCRRAAGRRGRRRAVAGAQRRRHRRRARRLRPDGAWSRACATDRAERRHVPTSASPTPARWRCCRCAARRQLHRWCWSATRRRRRASCWRLDDAQFLARWQRRFGWRLGPHCELGRRAAYPLSLIRAGAGVAQRAVLLGNAVAGAASGRRAGVQPRAARRGGARRAARSGRRGRAASAPRALLARFRRRRARRPARRHRLHRRPGAPVLRSARRGVAPLRDLGLLLFDLLPPAKRALEPRELRLRRHAARA